MTIRKNAAYIISFPVIDSEDRPNRLSGLTFDAGDVQLSKDGGSFAAATNLPLEIGLGRYSLSLTAAEMDADALHIVVSHAGMDDADLFVATGGQPSGQVVASGSNTSLTFLTDRTESQTDYWRYALILFTSGDLEGQVKRITGYNASTKAITVATALTDAPDTGDRFVLINL